MLAVVAATEPFPLVPAMCTAGKAASGLPRRPRIAWILSSPGFMPKRLSDRRYPCTSKPTAQPPSRELRQPGSELFLGGLQLSHASARPFDHVRRGLLDKTGVGKARPGPLEFGGHLLQLFVEPGQQI